MGLELISIKSPREIEAMRKAGRITAQARALAASMIQPGVTTLEIDKAVRRFIESQGAKPSFLVTADSPARPVFRSTKRSSTASPAPASCRRGIS